MMMMMMILIYEYVAVNPIAWVSPENTTANPLSWVDSEDCTELDDVTPGLPAPCIGFPTVDSFSRRAKKLATQSSFQRDVQ